MKRLGPTEPKAPPVAAEQPAFKSKERSGMRMSLNSAEPSREAAWTGGAGGTAGSCGAACVHEQGAKRIANVLEFRDVYKRQG